MNLNLRKALPAVALVGACALTLVGCGGGDGPVSPNDSSKVRVFNAVVGSPDASGAVNVYQRGAKLTLTPVGFGTAQPAGQLTQGNNYGTVASGTGIDTFIYGVTSQAALPNSITKVDFTRLFNYTLVPYGIFNTTTPDPNFPAKILRLDDSIPNITGTNNAAFRVVNIAPGSPNLTVYNISGTPPTAIAVGGLSNISYGNTSGYITLPAGNYNLSLRDAVSGTAFATPTDTTAISLQAAHAYTLFVIGQPNAVAPNQPFDARFVLDF